MLEEVGTISYSCLWPFCIFIEILHWEQEMWSEGLQWVWAGSSEAPFHKSLQPVVMGLHIPPRITTHSLFVFIKNYYNICFGSQNYTQTSVKTHSVSSCLVFPHIGGEINKWNNVFFFQRRLNTFSSSLLFYLCAIAFSSPQTQTTSPSAPSVGKNGFKSFKKTPHLDLFWLLHCESIRLFACKKVEALFCVF